MRRAIAITIAAEMAATRRIAKVRSAALRSLGLPPIGGAGNRMFPHHFPAAVTSSLIGSGRAIAAGGDPDF